MSEYGSAFFKVGDFFCFYLYFRNCWKTSYPLRSMNIPFVGKTIGTTRPDGFGQLPVEARAKDGQVRVAITAADEDGQR